MADSDPLPDCYLINLASRRDRLQQATSRLHGAGIPFTRFEAITTQSAALTPFKVTHDLRDREINLGDHGCAASHLTIYSMLLESENSWILILEDDVLLVKDAGLRIKKAFQSARDQADIIQYGWIDFHPTNGSRVKDLLHRVVGRGARRDRFVSGEVYGFGAGTHCYAVNRHFAERAIQFMNPVFSPIDIMIQSFVRTGEVRLLRHWPPLAVQDDSASDIADHRTHGVSRDPTW